MRAEISCGAPSSKGVKHGDEVSSGVPRQRERQHPSDVQGGFAPMRMTTQQIQDDLLQTSAENPVCRQACSAIQDRLWQEPAIFVRHQVPQHWDDFDDAYGDDDGRNNDEIDGGMTEFSSFEQAMYSQNGDVLNLEEENVVNLDDDEIYENEDLVERPAKRRKEAGR